MAHSRSNYIYDSDMAFRAPGSVAITANGATASLALSLDKITGAQHGDQTDKLGAIHYTIVCNVESLDLPLEFGIIAISGGALQAADAITITNGAGGTKQFVAGTDFAVGASAIDSATNLAAAINLYAMPGITAIDDLAGTVYVENTLTALGTIVEDVDGLSRITVTDFAANDKTYTIAVQTDVAGFASPTTHHSQLITETGQYVWLIDAETAEKLDADHEEIRLVLTIVDGTVNQASISYGAWLL